MPAIGRPRRTLVVSGVTGQLRVAAAGQVVNVNVITSDVAFLPRERYITTIGRPRWVFRIAALAHHGMHIRTVRIHDVDLLRPTAIGDERDLSSGGRIPGR